MVKALMEMMRCLPLKCLDRAEYRSLLAQNFASILTMMPSNVAHVSCVMLLNHCIVFST